MEEEIIKPKEPYKLAFKSSGESNENLFYWKLVLLRNTRNNYLSLTDKYVLPDYPITLEKLYTIKLYRQYLRDFINNNTEKIMNGEDIDIDPIPLI